MIRLVIDTDPGVDNALAIMAAFAHPEARGEAITTVAGNVSLDWLDDKIHLWRKP